MKKIIVSIASWIKNLHPFFKGVLGTILIVVPGIILYFATRKSNSVTKIINKDEFIKIDKNDKETQKLPYSEKLDKTLDEIIKSMED